MNIYQKFSLIVATLIACSYQSSPAKAGTIGTPYTPTLNANEASPANSNQIPTMAEALNNCNPNGTQVGIGGTNNGNTGKDIKPGDANGGKDSEPVPEPTTIAGATLAMAFGGWWKKKNAAKEGKNSTEVS
jgi:hypothetical protein